jgi:hypothetical protein
MGLPKKIENIIIYSTALFCILLTFLDFIGALESIIWLKDRISIMTLLAIGLIALYLLSHQNRNFNEIQNSIAANSKELHESKQQLLDSKQQILNKINLVESNEVVVDTINHYWKEREIDIRQFFSKLDTIPNFKNSDELRKYFKKYEDDFDNGCPFGKEQTVQYDINIVVYDLEGTILYHSSGAIGKSPKRDHPFWEIKDQRNGTLTYRNYQSGKVKNQLPDKRQKLFPRLTKIYFKEIGNLNIGNLNKIVTLQSHITLLPYLLELDEPSD